MPKTGVPDIEAVVKSKARLDFNAHKHEFAAMALTVVEIEVFSGNSPAVVAWTDLDLFEFVKSVPALVMLKFAETPLGGRFAVRKDGDTDEFYSTGRVAGCAAKPLTAFIHTVFLVVTSDAGVIEWKYGDTNEPVTIDIMANI